MRRLFVFALVAASAVMACQLFVNLDEEKGGDPPPPPPPDPCVHALAPNSPPPKTNAGGNSDEPPLVFAARHFVVHGDRGVIGFDLDDRCTGIDGSTTAGPGCVPSATAGIVLDEDGGIDNAFGQAFATVPGQGDVAAQQLVRNVDLGIFTLLVQLTHWNGQPDDDEIDVAVFTSSTVCRPTDAGGTFCWDGGPEFPRPAPQWDGNDRWSFVEDLVPTIPGSGDTILALQTTRGYVAKNKLVAPSNGRPLTFGVGKGALTLTTPNFVADLENRDGRWTLQNALVSGVVPADGMLAFVDRLAVEGTPVCKGALKETFEKRVCNLRDLNAAGDAGGPCDAVSFAFGFDAELASLHGPSLTPQDEDLCAAIPPSTCSP